MKKIIHAILIFVCVLFAQESFAESIDRYYVDMTLNTDSSIDIIETIDYNFGQNQRHGIFRFIPINYNVEGQEKMNGFQERKLAFSNLAVTRNGQPEIYTEKAKDSNGNYFVKIGDPNKTINGTHRYQIQYTVDGSLRYFEDFDEVYWNAIGLDWEIPIRDIKVTLRGGDPSLSFLNSSCYVGSVGSNQPCGNTIHRGNVITYSHPALSLREGFTIAASLSEKGMVEQNELFGLSKKASFLGIIGLIFSFILGIIYSVRRYLNKYKIYDPIYPRYEPPKGFSPVGIGYLVDKRFDGRDITAGIISLAQRGYIHIEQVKKSFFGGKDYIFSLVKERESDNEDTFDRELLDLIFSDSQKEIKLSKISKSHAVKTKESLRKHLNSLFVTGGYIENFFKKVNFGLHKIFTIVLIGFIMLSLPVILFFSFPLLILLYHFISKRYTRKGWEAKFAIEGFKDFLSMTEKDRYEFFNNPADNPQEFMEYLPYAIAMGVEKEWAKQFESITIENPEWYSGVDNFNSVLFASHISNLNKSLTSVSTVKSSGSGSGGGGFSGGGSGGGGGGSW